VLIFALCSLVFLVLPLFRSPVQDIWRWVSVSAGSILSDTVVVNTHNTCIVIAIPPHASFDTVLLECSSADNISEDNFVWFVEGADRYLVGKVTSAHNSRVVARMFTTSIATQPLGVRFAGFPERYSAVPLGGRVSASRGAW
jgi:hypothetical protein